MSDLREWLIERADALASDRQGHWKRDRELHIEAADEIARLTRELAEERERALALREALAALPRQAGHGMTCGCQRIPNPHGARPPLSVTCLSGGDGLERVGGWLGLRWLWRVLRVNPFVQPKRDIDAHTAPHEIERRFLVASQMEYPSQGRLIEQTYLSTGSPSVRVRREGRVYKLTAKSERAPGRFGRSEIEFTLKPAIGEALFQMGQKRTIKKTRHVLGRWELDVFHEDLAGLHVLEIELEAEDEPLPSFPEGLHIIREVTNDRRFDNAALAELSPSERTAFIKQPFRDELSAHKPLS